jgi:hypothetical protein
MSENRFYVYGLFDPKKEFPFYIGKGKKDRKNIHFYHSKKRINPHKNRKIEKIEREGRTPYAEKLYENLSEDEAYMREWCLINVHFPKLTNIKESYATEPPTMKGKNHPNYGKERSEETKQKISESLRGREHSKKTKQKISNSVKGKNNPMYGKTFKHCKETKRKMSEAKKGKNNPMYKKEFSEEHKQKISESNKGEDNPDAKLSKKEASEVKHFASNSNLTQKEIGDKYNIDRTTVSHIKNENYWSHIEPQKPF